MDSLQQSALSPAEADLLVRALKPIPVDEVGSNDWKDQRDAIEQLNHASHTNASQKKDDFVLAYLVQHEKLPVLLHELLTAEVWRQRVMHPCAEAIMKAPVGSYMYCYHESVIINLLECLMFHEEAVQNFGDDLPELIDYAWRQVSSLFADSAKLQQMEETPDPKKIGAGDIDPKKQFDDMLWQTHVSRTMGCISVLWFTIDRLNVLPLNISNAVLIKNDLPVGMAELILLQPWLRRGNGKLQKFIGSQFADIKNDEMMRVCAPEANAWFAMHFMLCDRECRKKYQYTQHRKEIILRIKRFLNETMVDQIPALVDVQRALEELSFMEPPSGTEEKFKNSLVIEQVPRLMASIDNRDRNWKKIVEKMKDRLMDPGAQMADAQRYAKIFDAMFGDGQ